MVQSTYRYTIHLSLRCHRQQDVQLYPKSIRVSGEEISCGILTGKSDANLHEEGKKVSEVQIGKGQHERHSECRAVAHTPVLELVYRDRVWISLMHDRLLQLTNLDPRPLQY